jgi:hypothetical protein
MQVPTHFRNSKFQRLGFWQLSRSGVLVTYPTGWITVLSIVNTRDPASREHAFMLEAKFVYIQGSTVMECHLSFQWKSR